MLKYLLVILAVLMGRPSYALECVVYAQQEGWAEFAGLQHAYKWWYAATEKESASYKPGYNTGHVPQVGALLVWNRWGDSYPASSGHVAIVSKTSNEDTALGEDEILVNHANWFGDGQIQLGTKVKDISGGHWKKVLVQYGSGYGATSYKTFGFIYQKGTTVPTMERLVLYRAGTVGWYPTTPICGQASEWYRLEQKSNGSWKAAQG